MAPTDRQPTESHLAAARSRMVSIQSSLHACVGRHLFSDCAASLPGTGLARAARFSLVCRRRPAEQGRRIFLGLRGIAGRDGIGSRGSPFPCLPAASLQEPENAERLLFYFGVQLRVNPAALQNKKAATSSQLFRLLRREGDSNPRYPLGVYTLSRRASSTTPASIRACFRMPGTFPSGGPKGV